MRYGSVCSGIEAASVAWKPLGWKAQWFSEIDPFPSAVLSTRFPDVPNLGDMTTIHQRKEFTDAPIDLLVGGTPCQSFSIAGLRKGIEDPRGNLSLMFLRLAAISKPRWIVWENVPGVLSSNGGRDFGAILRALEECGYGWAYRVLDAKYFGVPQRRRRLFLIGNCRDWINPAKILFDDEGGHGNSSEGGKETISIAGGTKQCPTDFGKTVTWWDGGNHSETLRAVLYKGATMPEKRNFPALLDGGRVRRLTPKEAERLQGFEDDWTAIQWKGKKAPDGLRLKACGNSMAVPVMRWIGERISAIENLTGGKNLC